jgi:hypothetical protein
MANDSSFVLSFFCYHWLLFHSHESPLHKVFIWLLLIVYFCFFFGLCLFVFSFALYFWWVGSHPWFWFTWFSYFPPCRNSNFGLVTKAKGLQGCEPRESPRVTSHIPRTVEKCEGVDPHTPKVTFTLGDGILVDSRNFRKKFQGSKLNGL